MRRRSSAAGSARQLPLAAQQAQREEPVEGGADRGDPTLLRLAFHQLHDLLLEGARYWVGSHSALMSSISRWVISGSGLTASGFSSRVSTPRTSSAQRGVLSTSA